MYERKNRRKRGHRGRDWHCARPPVCTIAIMRVRISVCVCVYARLCVYV